MWVFVFGRNTVVVFHLANFFPASGAVPDPSRYCHLSSWSETMSNTPDYSGYTREDLETLLAATENMLTEAEKRVQQLQKESKKQRTDFASNVTSNVSHGSCYLLDGAEEEIRDLKKQVKEVEGKLRKAVEANKEKEHHQTKLEEEKRKLQEEVMAVKKEKVEVEKKLRKESMAVMKEKVEVEKKLREERKKKFSGN